MFLAHRVPPRVNESLVGYLMRAAEANSMRSRESVLQAFIGTATRPPGTQEIEKLAEFTRCSISEIAQLFGFETRREHNSPCWRIGPEWITKRNFVSSRTLACCPECLKVDPYLPGTWELVFYRTCAIHRMDLVYKCLACGKPLRWTRRGVCHCQCGFDLRNTRSQLGSDASWTLAQLIERRLYPGAMLTVPSSIPVPMVERLAGLTLDGLFKTVWFLGHCVAESDACAVGHGRIQLKGGHAEQVVENAFALLRDWPKSLVDRLAIVAARPNGNKKASFYRSVLGPIATYMDEEITGEELAFLRNAYEYHIRRIWRELGRKPIQRFDKRQLELDLSTGAYASKKEQRLQ